MNNLPEILQYTKKMNLLYVEDNTEIRESISAIFQDFFSEIIFALDGEDGLEKFYENKIDIVMTDIDMPRLNGLDMARKIIKFDQTIPIIIEFFLVFYFFNYIRKRLQKIIFF